jgi:SulP family sulfate permease
MKILNVLKFRNFVNIAKKPLRQCPQLKIIRVDMSIYFGSIRILAQGIALLKKL